MATPENAIADAAAAAAAAGASADGVAQSSQTDEQLLGMTGVDGAIEPAKPAEGDKGAEAAAAAAAGGKPAGEEAAGEEPFSLEPLEGEKPPAWLDPLLADAKTGPEAKALWESNVAYRAAFGTPAEAQQVKELLPGGVEQARALVEQAKEFTADDAALYSADPRAQGESATKLYQSDPEAFTSMFRASAQLLAQQNPETWNQIGLETVKATVAHTGLAESLGNLIEAARAGDDAAIERLFPEFVKKWTDLGLPTQAARRARGEDGDRQQFQKQREQFDRERTDFDNQRAQALAHSTLADVDSRLKQSVTQNLTKIPQIAKATEGMRTRIVEEVLNEIDKRMKANTWLQNQIGQLLSAPRGRRNTDPEAWKKASDLSFNAGKALVVPVIRDVLNDWTKAKVAEQKDKTARASAAAEHREAAGGPGKGPTAQRLTNEKLYKMSDEEILELP